MADSTIIPKIVRLYWQLDDLADMMVMSGYFTIEEIIGIRNQQIELDSFLTNTSKRWAQIKKNNGCPIRED